MLGYEEEEDELQLLLEGREVGDDELVESAFASSTKSLANKKAGVKKKRRPLLHDLDDNDEDEAEDMDDNMGEEEPMRQYVNEYDEEEDDGHPKFDEAMEVPESSGKAKKNAESTKKKIVRNPRFILNEELLKHVDGVAALPKLFKPIKFKGKGHEKDDLNLIMSVYERWAHRLMPSLQFDDFIEKTENLTRKAKMKTFLTKIRYDMPLDVRGGANDFVTELPDVEPEVQSDVDNFEPISYLPDKEFSFSDDDDQLFGTMSLDANQVNSVKYPADTILDKPAEEGDEEKKDDNLIARTRRKALVSDRSDDDEKVEPNSTVKMSSVIETNDQDSQSSSDSVNKRKRFNDESDREEVPFDTDSNNSEDVALKRCKSKRRKLVIEDDDEEMDETKITDDLIATEENKQQITESVSERLPEFNDTELNKKTESISNEVTEDEFMALLNN